MTNRLSEESKTDTSFFDGLRGSDYCVSVDQDGDIVVLVGKLTIEFHLDMNGRLVDIAVFKELT